MRPARLKRKPKAEMNVVPYIDVMLVLLVIFMVTAPMLTQGVQIELPKVASETLAASDPSVVTLSIDVEGNYHWNEGSTVQTDSYQHSAGELSELTNQLAAIIREKPETQVMIRADSGVGYGQVVTGMAALQQAGVTSLGLITEAP
ncbi:MULTISPECIES: protein TolR [Pseudomonas]|uniref:Tol-Pal system protein TolR n=1 Tax=Pseudomonas neustonica TaxID=2487346 RepID=A0ABX9XIL9_9PSED|nr:MULTISPECIES: protein TolR [Pseudomonas]MAB22832.1 protein TolR [Pseudomonadales bacterium]MBA6419926.1 protein TolR [Pseudomonas sp. 5Ae-yellow]ROZ83215.1 protein TolR [Pseudomonas sp. SSM44]ROZ85256.1 protein TolR [Pseudomonas neustonica]|tara:strand:- start:477 stop:914 length:438 start_codon:yes stop_codon:yes gene_type:complete